MKTLELICFGPPTARIDGKTPPADVLWRKHLALLIYLALSPDHGRSRSHLLGLLWPDKPEENARHSLSEAVRRLRTHLGAERLESDGDAVAISKKDLVVDVLSFEALAEQGSHNALAVFRGDFFDGVYIEDAPDFEDWAAGRRAHYRTWAASLLVTQAEAGLASNRLHEAQKAARDALLLRPTLEPAVYTLIRATALAGDTAGALQTYQEFRSSAGKEITAEFARDLKALSERIEGESWRRRSRVGGYDAPLIGRPEVHSSVFAMIEEGARNGPRILVITSDPGMGKTRLLKECLERLTLAGAVAVMGRPIESDYDAPWSTLRLLLQSGLTTAPGMAGVRPEGLGVLASLVPELEERAKPTEPRDNSHVAASLASLLSSIATEQPVVIAIDDAQYADGSTIGALGSAIEQLHRASVILLLTADRNSTQSPPEFLKLVSRVGRDLLGRSVRLDPLAASEMRAMVETLAPWCEDPEDLDRLTKRMVHEAGGSPFLASTLLHKLEKTSTLKDDLLSWPPPGSTLESPLPFTIPDLARLAIAARVGALGDDSRRVLNAASITGLSLDVDLVANLAELPRARVEETLDELERHRFLTFDGGRYMFPAQLVAHVVRSECLTRGSRRRLRERAAAELASRDDLGSKLLRAELLAKIGTEEEAFSEAVAVAEAAHLAGAERTVARALGTAEMLAAEDGEEMRDAVKEARLRLER